MEEILNNLVKAFVADPLLYIGMVLSAYAVLGFLTFLNGFISGAGHIIPNSGHAEHQLHARVRAIMGLLNVAAVFLVWEVIRFVASWFGYTTMNTTVGVVALALFAFWVGYSLLFGAKGGHH